MKLIEFPEQTTIIAKNQPQYLPMPAWINVNRSDTPTVCCWKLSIRERLKVLISGKLWHTILTFRQPMQPQRLEVDKPLL